MNQLIIKIDKINLSIDIKAEEKQEATEYEEKTKDILNIPVEEIVLQEINENIWQIEIPKINLIAPIEEGTTVDILNSYVGHFEETEVFDGNIGLAAHNRGYPVNYFQRIKELEKGDKIIYKYYGNERCYIVDIITIIQDTDWSYLQNTNDNRITLITCVEDMPSVRRCIQAIEITN